MAAAVLCGDIRHTLGATEYAWLSYLALAMRCRQVLNADVQVYLPRSLGGLRADLTVARQSLNTAMGAAGVALEWTTASSCDHENYDIRVTDHLHSRLDVGMPPPPAFNASHPRALDEFMEGMWAYLRAAATSRTARPAGGPLRISLSLVQATPGPLAHAAAALHAEALAVIRAAEIARPFAAAGHPRGHPSSSCAYVFLGLHLGVGAMCEQRGDRRLESLCHGRRSACAAREGASSRGGRRQDAVRRRALPPPAGHPT